MLDYLGKKLGMTHSYNDNGNSTAITMIKLYDNIVFNFDDADKNTNRVAIAFNKIESKKNISKSHIGKFEKKNLPLFAKIKESKIKKSKTYNVGDIININDIINVGDKISISGISIGKGFAGGMKRWGFGGLEATHGVSVSHRSHGSTGQCQDPGKVFKGKKMAGHMGANKVTTKNLEVYYINIEQNIIAVKGCIPGFNGNDVVLGLKL
jgi:large subunit ribosomal protein L3|tara:strand:+ start:395 stop:1021 length:627 start_codon:yes stop_codon:yes gene_type:complete